MPCKAGALSFCMIVKNAERDLPECLDSIRHLATEMIVVDTGSTDATPKVAAEHGAKVFPFEFERVDFAAARNRAIERAGGGWILMLDADERLEPESVLKIPALLARNENSGYFLERLNHASDSPTTNCDWVVRLFPNREQYRYRGRVHETIDASILGNGGKLQPADIRIRHNFISDRETRRRKNHWYIAILKEEIVADPNDTSRLDFLAAEYHQLEMFNEATAVMEQIVNLRPKDARAHLFLGTYYFVYQHETERARIEFERALQLKPGYPEALGFLKDIAAHCE